MEMTKQMDTIRLWYNYTNWCEKLLKWIWQNYTNGCNKTKQMDLTKLYKSKG